MTESDWERGDFDRRMRLLLPRTEELATKKIIVFGAGYAGKLTHFLLRFCELETAYFIDNDPDRWGTRFLGREVRGPDALLEEPAGGFSIWVASTHERAITDQLTQMGFQHDRHFTIASGNPPKDPPEDETRRAELRERVHLWLDGDQRIATFDAAVNFVNYQKVEGDILEFGVASGRSLALLARLHRDSLQQHGYSDATCVNRRIVGFDSFAGLPDGCDAHGRLAAGEFQRNLNPNHPLLAPDEPLSRDAIRRLFDAAGDLSAPQIEVGPFEETLPGIDRKYPKAAIIHIDSDLYESAATVLESLRPALQEGSVLLFDDWFLYQGSPERGEARALSEFLDAHPEWRAAHYRQYGVHGNAFIATRVNRGVRRFASADHAPAASATSR